MGYAHIPNLYQAQEILLFKECFALCKIHGTSAHLYWKDDKLSFSSGGEKHDKFVKVFAPELPDKFRALGHDHMVVYGEAFGGSQQGMSATYGKTLKFVVFDVKVGDTFLNVTNADDVAQKLGLEFVAYEKISATLEAIDAQRDADSVQAVRNGMGSGHKREGIVLRPLIELSMSNGERIISKHKREEFRETATPREVDPVKQKILEESEAIAFEWVTQNRLAHVLQKLPEATDMEHTGMVIRAMVEDVTREAKGEIVDSKDARKAIGARAAKLFKEHVQKKALGTETEE